MTKALKRPTVRAITALVVLVIVGGLLAPSTVTIGVWQAMLPFVAILGLAGLGQHLVIQQRGFDLSVAGVISLAAVIATMAPSNSSAGEIVLFLVLALLAGLASGILAGFFVAVLGVAPVVTTIGVNALLLGVTVRLTGGVPGTAPLNLIAFSTDRVAGVPVIFLIFLLAVAVMAFMLNASVIGRRFVAVGTNPHAASMLAISVRGYQLLTYGISGIFFAMAGVLLAGYLTTPTVFSGNPYMLTTVAAFVVGGNALSGERSSVIATAIGVVFLTYLDQLLVSLGIPRSVQNIVQAMIVIAGVALPEFARRLNR
ncbi:ABC transporter permease [Rhizobium sp. 2YAF20]|uniref:ABC transporter permease n=1 Tax=Rhizobium sp. 2YAF20 TaxID=3233027 RepID=UPI003F9C5F48